MPLRERRAVQGESSGGALFQLEASGPAAEGILGSLVTDRTGGQYFVAIVFTVAAAAAAAIAMAAMAAEGEDSG